MTAKKSSKDDALSCALKMTLGECEGASISFGFQNQCAVCVRSVHLRIGEKLLDGRPRRLVPAKQIAGAFRKMGEIGDGAQGRKKTTR
jgi:hypothetical protein